MKRRYINFYKLRLFPIPHFMCYGHQLTDNWKSCFIYGLNEVKKGNASFFYFQLMNNEHFLPFR